ncbi:MAG TPA: hypothetical protein DCG33_01805 [Prevotellaceae bacterium]|nr:hypothetical protein [Prevotellaceae bacterium]
MKFVHYIICFLLSSNLNIISVAADNGYAPSKINVELQSFIRQSHQIGFQKAARSRGLSAGVTATKKINLAIYCSHTADIKAKLDSMGICAHDISASALTAYVPVDKIEEVSQLSTVKRIVGLRHKRLLMDKARAATEADQILNGTGLETPYTGKGVIIGIIDCGIEYDHLAFRESKDSTRIIAAWNMGETETSPIYGSANIIAEETDGVDECHGTHVTGIAAGGKTMGSSTYYGIAPGAEIVAVGCSDLSDANLLNGMDLIRTEAEKRGMPWVANMSLGSNIHAHDGYEEFSMVLDTMVINGGHIVSAAGNEGNDYIHAMYDFTSEGEQAFFLIDDGGEEEIYLYLVGEDSAEYTLEPYLYNTDTKTLTPIPTLTWYNSGSEIYAFHNEHTRRYETQVYASLSGGPVDLIQQNKQKFAICITGKTGSRVHSWVEPGCFMLSPNTKFSDPDRSYQINSPAIGRHILAIGSYTSSKRFKTYKGTSVTSSATEGDLSFFSSVGPSLDNLQKPDVCAPGQWLISAYNGKNKSFILDNYISEINTFDGEKFYYGAMQGTSMATPVVTGIIALWLEANPDLTHKQILDILHSTSMPFNGQNHQEWNYRYGYGKIQAYEGLKSVLAINAGISTMRNTEQPVTILKENNQWRLLFNSSENFAKVTVHALDGRQMYSLNFSYPERGQEEILYFNNLPKGVYLIRIQTRNSTSAHKIVIR